MILASTKIALLAVALTTAVPAAFAQSAGHRVGSDRITVSGRNHWQNWSFAPGTLAISAAGAVQPRRMSKNTNAVFDIVDYLRFNPPASLGGKEGEEITLADAIQGGSNLADIPNILDGDMETYWEPALAADDIDLASQWWLVVDLGRLVLARELVVHFVAEGLGDPFMQFEVLVSDGLKPARLQTSTSPAYRTVLRTLSANKSQRVFRVDLRGEGFNPDIAPVRFVQVLVTHTAGMLGTELPQAEYKALAADDRGAVQHFKRQPDGREVPVTQGIYGLLDQQRQGRVRYYRRERPRLAELEVIGEGDEVVAGILERGGVISTSTTQTLALRSFADGNLETVNGIFFGVSSAVADPEKDLVFDLGSFYWLDTYWLSYTGSGGRFGSFQNYRVDFSDGSLAPDGSLAWVTRVDQGPRPRALYEGARFEPIKARFARVQWTMETIGARVANMSEMQLYGLGFQPEVSLTSDLIRLGGSRNLQSIEWDADTPPGTQVLIQTRTGDELGEVLRYFKKDGTEVTEDEYGKLLSLFKGDIVAEQVPGSDWSDFSEPYENASGSSITSPSPREFLEIKATLLSDDPTAGPTLRSIRLNFADPVAQSVAGEIAPFQVEELGVKQPFSLYVRPDFVTRDPGFDELLLVAPGNMELDLVSLYGGRETDFAGEIVDLASLALENVEVVPTGRDSLHLRFDEIRPRGAVQVLRLDFETSLFVAGAVLQASLRNSGEGDAWQRVDPGEALDDVLSNTTTLVASVSNTALLTDVLISPQVFSPNGDGINDATMFSFNVVRVGDDSPVVAAIFDLSGRRVRRVAEQRAFSTGEYQMGWDGRDGEGRIVPPGIYMLRLSIDTDTEGARVGARQIFRSLTVVY